MLHGMMHWETVPCLVLEYAVLGSLKDVLYKETADRSYLTNEIKEKWILEMACGETFNFCLIFLY